MYPELNQPTTQPLQAALEDIQYLKHQTYLDLMLQKSTISCNYKPNQQ